MANFCGHAFWKDGDPENMWCDNFTPPRIVDDEKDCANCSVGMIRRMRDSRHEEYLYDELDAETASSDGRRSDG